MLRLFNVLDEKVLDENGGYLSNGAGGSFRPMNDAHEEQVDDPQDKEIFIAGMSYWTSHPDLDTFNSDKLVTIDFGFLRFFQLLAFNYPPLRVFI